MAVTILDIAKQAGVSKSTVSRVLNGGIVSPKTREAVERTMKEMNFSPNYMARGLRGVQNSIIGVLSLGSNIFQHPFISKRLAGILDTLSENDCDLMVVHEDLKALEAGAEPKYVQYLRDQRIQGLITLGWDDVPAIQQASEKFRNVVYCSERQQTDKGFRVYHGNYYYSSDLYRILVSQGHSRILTLTDPSPNSSEFRTARMKACGDVCRQNSITYDEGTFFDAPTELSLDAAYLESVYREFIRGGYTAIFADEMPHAKAILYYFQKKGLSCPEDYSLVTVKRDDTEESFITSAFISDYSYGVTITKLMLEVIKNDNLNYQDIIMPYSLEMRKSVSSAPCK